ncbi:HPF/RaiA family ribosome-associated protein [Patescibacteria group bacterium]|nr:HPF/RaiA family ribosome-associated protein [Patescibacteria group bacterium]
MRIIPNSKNLNETDKKKFLEYLEEKMQRIKPFMEAHYPDPDTVKAACRIQRHERHNAYEITFDITAPRGGKFNTKVVKHNINEAMDLAVDKLEDQVREHFKILTRS